MSVQSERTKDSRLSKLLIPSTPATLVDDKSNSVTSVPPFSCKVFFKRDKKCEQHVSNFGHVMRRKTHNTGKIDAYLVM